MAKKFGDAYIDVNARTAGALAEINAFAKAASASLKDVDEAGKLKGFEDGDERTKRLNTRLSRLKTRLDKSTKSLLSTSNGAQRMSASFDRIGVGVDRSLTKVSRNVTTVEKDVDRLDHRITRAAKNFFAKLNPFPALLEKQRRSWARMDSTVRLVIGLILSSGGPVASALSGMSAALAAVAGSAAYAVAGLAPLVGILPGLALGVGLAVGGLQDLEKYSAGASQALGNLKAAFTDVNVPAFMEQWAPSLEGFFASLTNALSGGELAASLGSAFAGITDAFTGLVDGPAFQGFLQAMQGPLAVALENIGTGLATVIEGLLTFFTAAAPAAQTLSEQFERWATAWTEGIGAAASDGSLNDFFMRAAESLNVVLDLVGALGDLLGTVFAAGVDSGDSMLSGLTESIAAFNEHLQGEGAQALQDFFTRGEVIMSALGGVLIGLSEAFDNMVTPETTALFVDFANTISDILPIVGSLLEIISHLGILNLVADLFEAVGDALVPVMPVLKTLAETIFTALGTAIQAFAPILATVGELIGILAEAITPIVGALGGALVTIFNTLAPILVTVVEALEPVIMLLADALMSAIEAVLPFIVDLIDKLGPVLTAVIQALLPILEALFPIFESLLPVFTALLPALFPIINLIAELAPIIIPLIDLVAQLVVWLLELITPLIDLIAPILELVAQFLVANLAVSRLGKVFSDVFTRIFVWFDDMVKAVGKWADDVLNWFTNFGTRTTTFFSNFVHKFFSTWANLLDDVILRISYWVDNVGLYFASLVDDVVRFFTRLWDDIVRIVNGLTSGVVSTLNKWVTRVVTIFLTINDKITAFFTNIKDGAKEAIDGFVGFFLDIPNRIAGVFSGIGETVGGFLDLLPGFAAGGVVTGPTTALVGEAGPEAIVPLNRPLYRVDPAVRDISAALQGKSTLPSFASGGIAGGGVTIAEGAITVMAPESNPELVAESVIDRIAAYAR